MVNVNMIDTIGSGIKRAFRTQRERGFPLPDYELEKADRVVVSISGKVIDENYTRALLSELDLSLDDVIALDKVQKRKGLTEAEQRSLKLKKLIEGRRPNFYVSARVAAATGREVEHVLNSGLEDSHYKELVLTLLRKFGPATPEQINGVLLAKLPTILSDQQKKDKVRNLIQEMSKKDKSIRNTGKRGKGAIWALLD
jgi:ATP-dependent DNA helicase RecG